MNGWGVGFTVFNAVMAIVFLVVSAPVVNYRIDMRKQIDAEIAKIDPLKKDIQDLDRKRVKLHADLTRQLAVVESTVTLGENQKSELEKLQALETDRLNNAETQLERWKGSLTEVQGEVAARDQEVKDLTQTAADLQDQLRTHQGQVDNLQKNLDETLQAIEDSKSAIKKHYERILAAIAEWENQRQVAQLNN